MYSMKIVKRKDYLMRNKNNRKIRQFNFQRQDRKVSLTKITKYVEDLYTAKTREFLGKAANENISKIYPNDLPKMPTGTGGTINV